MTTAGSAYRPRDEDLAQHLDPLPTNLGRRRPGPPITILDHGRPVVLVGPPGRLAPPAGSARRRRLAAERQPATTANDIRRGVEYALALKLPLVIILRSPRTGPHLGIDALAEWGAAARAVADCAGTVPVVMIADGVVVGDYALILGLAELVIVTSDTLAYVSGPAAVHELTGQDLDPSELGGSGIHSRRTGVATLEAQDVADAVSIASDVLSFLPDDADNEPPVEPCDDPLDRPTPELEDLLPASETGSYDVRRVIESVADYGEAVELRAGWAPQLVTSLIRIGGRPVGVIANQPQSMAGTLDIAASQKGARFVSMCDVFNVPLLTLVDTPGFMPGKDLEWRGMIRKGAELVYAYAEATVPRVCLVLRKAFGGAYIVMDSKGMGNDICLAWPDAQIAVMGAAGAVSILHRRESAETQAKLADQYKLDMLNPYVAASRGFVDDVIDPAATRLVVGRSLDLLASKREVLVGRKHGNGPL